MLIKITVYPIEDIDGFRMRLMITENTIMVCKKSADFDLLRSLPNTIPWNRASKKRARFPNKWAIDTDTGVKRTTSGEPTYIGTNFGRSTKSTNTNNVIVNASKAPFQLATSFLRMAAA
jgi:hypothetical protein